MSVLGIGPGSCGTHTLAALLDHMGLDTIHEDTMMFRIQGLVNPDNARELKKQYPKALQNMPLENCDWVASGDWLAGRSNRALVGFPYGFMVYYLRHRVSRLPVICMHREKDEWLESTKGKVWRVDLAESWPLGVNSLEEFWEIYHHLMKSIPSPVLHLNLEELSSSVGKVRGFSGV